MYLFIHLYIGARGSTVVEALYYKPEGRNPDEVNIL
jgi:hypothetical protein